jgi:hypothetical protein
MSAPPRLASWLLNQFLLGEHRDSIIGDLTERYIKQPSSLWYWRQATTAIIVSFVAQALAHIWLVLGVLGLSLLIPRAYVMFLLDSVMAVHQILARALLNWSIEAGVTWLYDYSVVLVGFALGSLILCGVFGVLALLLVRRRPHERGLMLSVLIMSCIAQGFPALSGTVRQFLNAPTSPLPVFLLFVHSFFMFVVVPYSILTGGRRPSERP